MKPKVAPLSQEREFYLHELFFSTTDKKGIIQSGNDVFARVSGYTMAELLGQPHNIIRHPDMPRAVFKLLWDYLEQGKSIVAFVKNMAADGRYYWVVALVTALDNGYLSIRFKPSSEILTLIQTVYKELVTLENDLIKSGASPKEAMQAATEKLLSILQTKGFENYDSFMHFVLRAELKSREETLRSAAEKNQPTVASPLKSAEHSSQSDQLLHRLADESAVIADTLAQLFSKLDDFVLLGEKLEGKVEFISDLAQSMRILSLNTGVASSHLEKFSEVLTSIAKLMGENSRQLNANVQRIGEHLLDISASLKTVVYDLAAARLQLEMLRNFLAELTKTGANQMTLSLERNKQNHVVTRIVTLQNTFLATYKRALAIFQNTESDLRSLTREGSELQRSVQTLQFVHLVGRVEITRDAQLTSFGNILEEVRTKIQNTKSQLDELSDAISYLLGEVDGLGKVDRRVSESLQQMGQDAQLLASAFAVC